MTPRVSSFLKLSLVQTGGRWALPFFWVVAGVYGAASVELNSRGNGFFREGEKFRRWSADRSLRALELEKDFLANDQRLERLRQKERWTDDEFRLKQNAAQSRFDERRRESSFKRAYFAYRDVYRLSSPPENRWTRRARWLAPAAKEAWREETARAEGRADAEVGELDPGETHGRRVVYSTVDRQEAALLLKFCREAGMDVTFFSERAVWITVAQSDFWPAHNTIQKLLAFDSSGFGPA